MPHKLIWTWPGHVVWGSPELRLKSSRRLALHLFLHKPERTPDTLVSAQFSLRMLWHQAQRRCCRLTNSSKALRICRCEAEQQKQQHGSGVIAAWVTHRAVTLSCSHSRAPEDFDAAPLLEPHVLAPDCKRDCRSTSTARRAPQGTSPVVCLGLKGALIARVYRDARGTSKTKP